MSIFRIFGVRIALALRKAKYKTVTLQGYSVSEWNRRKVQQENKQQQVESSHTLPARPWSNVVHYDATATGVGKGGIGVVSMVQVGEEESMGEVVRRVSTSNIASAEVYTVPASEVYTVPVSEAHTVPAST